MKKRWFQKKKKKKKNQRRKRNFLVIKEVAVNSKYAVEALRLRVSVNVVRTWLFTQDLVITLLLKI